MMSLANQYTETNKMYLDVPIYLVSPQLLVTSEHIISASASSSLPSFSGSCSSGSGEAVPLLGLGRAGCAGVPFVVESPLV